MQQAAAGTAQVGAAAGALHVGAAAGAQQLGAAAGAQQLGAGAQQSFDFLHLFLNLPQTSLNQFFFDLQPWLWPQQSVTTGAQQLGAAATGAQQLGAAGAGAGAQQLGAGAQQLGSGAQQSLLPWWRKKPASAELRPATQTKAAAIQVIFISGLS